ncbi:hypothetical protein KP509_01G080400 [Ceratopteris richardii]|uniref:Reverse transcriptase zinc-binding domain-containing protein n=1 Tax=Ceratopteris richardii TaxID=49495 RepID=A0A8T2VMA8_CERRI|nr:hypothetical protein KP509_01G080400 [Ceratopteris richardii]
MRMASSQKPLWGPIFWRLIENVEVNFRGCWKLDAWNKFFSHAPLQTSSCTINFWIHHFKFALSTLEWNGRQRYVGNSLTSLSPFSSFLFNPSIAYSLGAAKCLFLGSYKGIDSIAKCYNSKWEILSFPEVQRLYAVGEAYKSKWFQVVSLLQKYQMPLSLDASEPWRDWLFAKHTRWWAGKSNTYYRTLIALDSIVEQCNQRWKFKKAVSSWHLRFLPIWDSSYNFKMKLFMWKVFVGHFTLGAFLNKHGMLGIRCPHCTSYVENMRHAF